MRNLFRRIWRFLNYAPDTYSKVEEVRELVSTLSDGFPKGKVSWNLRVKIAAMETDLRYLKTITDALQNQLNYVQDHLRSSQPWLPMADGSSQRPEGWLLTSLVSFFPNPIAVNIGINDDRLFELLLGAGFEIYTFKSREPTAAGLLERFSDCPRLRVIDSTGDPWRLLTETKEIPADFSVLRITTKDLDSLTATGIDSLGAKVVDTAFSRLDTAAADEFASSKKLIRAMRTWDYHWNLLVFRIGRAPAFRFAANLVETPDMSSGELFFFKDFELFERTYRWAQLLLPRFQHQSDSDKASERIDSPI